MKQYVLDTNIVSYCLKGLFDLERKIESVLDNGDAIILSPITLYEILRGLYAVKANRRLALFSALCRQFEEKNIVIDDWIEAAKLYAENMGRPMSESDLLQAAFCIRNGYTLVTHNAKHFEHLQRLVFEDWVMDR
jgi:tRNA(fMet)-specific endonuclease VapC